MADDTPKNHVEFKSASGHRVLIDRKQLVGLVPAHVNASQWAQPQFETVLMTTGGQTPVVIDFKKYTDALQEFEDRDAAPKATTEDRGKINDLERRNKRLEAEVKRMEDELFAVVDEVAYVAEQFFTYTVGGQRVYTEPTPHEMVARALQAKDHAIACLRAGLVPVEPKNTTT